MTSDNGSLQHFLIDADVLLDFVKTNLFIIDLIGSCLGTVYVTSDTVVEEIGDTTEQNLQDHRIIIIEPELADAYKAASIKGKTSFRDRLCFYTAKRNNMICVTNDSNLRKLCIQEGVETVRSLRLVANLYKVGGISYREAITIANEIKNINTYITENIIDEFKSILKE